MRLTALFLIGLVSWEVFADNLTNCRIRIENVHFNGERKKIQFSTKLGSKQECQTLAGFHKPNFEPNITKTKSVNYQWNGPALAYRSSGKNRKTR